MPVDMYLAVTVLLFGLDRRPEAFGQCNRRSIGNRNHTRRCCPPMVLVGGLESPAGGFGGVALAVMIGDERPRDLRLNPAVRVPQAANTGESPGCLHFDRPGAVPAQRPVTGIYREFSPRFFSTAGAAVELRDWVGEEVDHRLEVITLERAEQQSRGFDNARCGHFSAASAAANVAISPGSMPTNRAASGKPPEATSSANAA